MTDLTLQLVPSAPTQQQGKGPLCSFWVSKHSDQFTGPDLDMAKRSNLGSVNKAKLQLAHFLKQVLQQVSLKMEGGD